MDSELRRDAEDASTPANGNGDAPTRHAKRPPPKESPETSESGAAAESSSRSEPRHALDLSFQALRKEERWRLRITARVMIGIVCICLLLTVILGGDPFAKRVYIAGLVFAMITMGALLRYSYVATFDMRVIGAAGIGLTITNTCGLYYIGTYSETAMPAALALYAFCLGGSTRWAVAVYAALAVPHAVLATSIVAGWLPDRGLVSGAVLSGLDQVALLGFAQAVYATAFVAGRASRRKLERVLNELEAAARLLAQRDVLLDEAKRELERAARIGGEGRFTEQVVGSYRLGNVIGRGGMGEVYEAVHVETQTEAAVKLLHRHGLCDANSLARFARETRLTQTLNSPHVVRVLEVPEEHAHVPYLAMERLRGEDLASMLRREHRLSSRELIALAQQVGRGLDAARNAGITHRDIKPQNLFFARRDSEASVWKILDFGVSRLSGQATLTRDELVGTPEYMAPEQAAGKQVDHRADLYGLAAVLYRCVASRAPFVGDALATLVHRVIYQMPPPPSSLARVSRDVEAVLAIGLAKDPEARFTTGAELAEAFEQAVRGELSPPLRARATRILERTPWSPS